MTDSEKEISDLCVTCGMCCDGTLFTRARVRDEADRKIADDLGLTTFESTDNLHFKLPCHHFSTCCTVYDQQRPSTCSSFFCNPIGRVRRGEQQLTDARQQVQSLLENRDKFMKVASQFPEFEGLGFREIKGKIEALSDDNDKVTAYRHLFLLLFVFENVRVKYFEVPKKDEIQ